MSKRIIHPSGKRSFRSSLSFLSFIKLRSSYRKAKLLPLGMKYTISVSASFVFNSLYFDDTTLYSWNIIPIWNRWSITFSCSRNFTSQWSLFKCVDFLFVTNTPALYCNLTLTVLYFNLNSFYPQKSIQSIVKLRFHIVFNLLNQIQINNFRF